MPREAVSETGLRALLLVLGIHGGSSSLRTDPLLTTEAAEAAENLRGEIRIARDEARERSRRAKRRRGEKMRDGKSWKMILKEEEMRAKERGDEESTRQEPRER